MTKLNTIDIDAVHAYANVIKQQHKEMLKARQTYIQEMYKILRRNNYTRVGAINSIYVLVSETLDSMIEVRKSFIEQATEKLK